MNCQQKCELFFNIISEELVKNNGYKNLNDFITQITNNFYLTGYDWHTVLSEDKIIIKMEDVIFSVKNHLT